MAKEKFFLETKNILIVLGVFVVVFLIGILAFLQFSGTANFLSIFGFESVYKANWGHICCEEGAYEPKYIRWADAIPNYKCNSYTDECRIQIEVIDPPLFNLRMVVVEYDICNLDGSNCRNYDYIGRDGDIKTIYVPYGKEVNFINPAILGWDHRSYYKYSADYRKFYIQGEENGKIFVAKSCILNSALKQRVLAGGLNELSKSGINRCQNYITDYILVDTKTYNYNLREVVCQARDIYEIDKITLLDGSTSKIQGERIKDVDCCPTEANCDEDFKFKAGVEKECTYNYQCPNGGEPVALTGTSYVKYQCVSGICKKSNPFIVECTNNAICVDKFNKPNMVCVNFKCVEDDVWLGHCGDGKCESILGETPTSCPDDCGDWEEKKGWWDNLYLLPILLTLGMSVMWGWKERKKTGKYHWLDFVIGGILGLGIGFALFFIIKNIIPILVTGFVLGGGALIVILVVGGIPLLISLLNIFFGRK